MHFDYLIVDASNLAFTSYFSTDLALKSPEGFPTNMILGFYRKFFTIAKKYKPSVIFTAMEGGKTFRSDIHPEYKAGRREKPADLTRQLRALPILCKTMGWNPITVQGFEADDVMCSFAKNAEKEGKTTLIYSQDKDLLCLHSELTRIHTKVDGTEGLATTESITAKFGVPPNKVNDFLCLAGDTADNIPGVYKIGAVTAAKLINEYGTSDAVFENLDKITGKTGEHLRNGVEQYKLSKSLVTMREDVIFDVMNPQISPDIQGMKAIFDKLGMHHSKSDFEAYYKLNKAKENNEVLKEPEPSKEKSQMTFL